MNRRGGALPAALLLVVLLGALALLGLGASRIRLRSGERALSLARARAAALSGIARGEAGWDQATAAGLPVGVAAPLPGTPTPPLDGVESHDSLLRLGKHLFLIRSVGEHRTADGHLLAREGIARLLRVEGPGVPDSAAAIGPGPIILLADSSLSGQDVVPLGWAGRCPAPDSGRAGLIHGGLGFTPGCASGICLSGNPAALADTLLLGGFLDRLPVAGFPILAARADLRVSLPSVTPSPQHSAGGCDRSALDNWGDPDQSTAPCGGYFPLIWVDAGTVMADGKGQGILLAAGDLTLSGVANFTGAVLARGRVQLQDQARVTGVVLAEGGLTVEGTARAERSRCAVRLAVEGAARPVRATPRGWWRWP